MKYESNTSPQYTLLLELWNYHAREIAPLIIREADHILEYHEEGKLGCGCPEVNGTICINDELWVPLDIKAGETYTALLGHLGNAEDECQLLSNIWILVLSQDAKYLPIIAHLAHTGVHGL